MPTIKISRKKEWAIHSVPFEVFLDGQKIGYLSKGETREFDISAGQHKIKVKTGRYGSKDIEYTTFNKESKSLIVSKNWAMTFLPHFLIITFVIVRFFHIKGYIN